MAWKMFVIIFIFAFVLTYVTAEIPPYMHVCGLRNPNIDKCLLNSIKEMKDVICQGLPELDSPSLEPLNITKIAISDVDNAKLYVKDITITGFCNFIINSVSINLDQLYFNISILLKEAFINGTYDFDIHILVPFAHKGQVYFTSKNLIGNARFDMKVINKGDKRYIYVSRINLNLEIASLTTKFDVKEEESSQLNQILNTFVGSNKQEFIRRVKPSIEKEVSEQILSLSNNILKRYTYDELFPDRE